MSRAIKVYPIYTVGAPIMESDVDPDGISVEGDTVQISCSISYALTGTQAEKQLWNPIISWSVSGAGITVDESATVLGSLSKSTLSVSGVSRNDQRSVFTCDIFFNNTNTDFGYSYALNTPDYTHSITSSPLEIQCKNVFI